MSDKTVAQKLMIKEGQRLLLVNAPPGYETAIGTLPTGASVLRAPQGPVDAIQVFVASRKELEEQLGVLKGLLSSKGILWVTYYKGTAKHKTDINRDTIFAYAKTCGLQGVAIIAVDDDWSAMRLKLL